MAFDPDPFTQVYDVLMARLVAHPVIAQRVRPGNRVDYSDEARSRVKKAVQPADLPELRLVPVGADLDSRTSAGPVLVRKYAIVLVTDQVRVDRDLHQLDWAVFQVLTAAWLDRLGLAFVQAVGIGNVQNSEDLAAYLRNVTGWSAVWTCTVKLGFGLADLIPGGGAGTPQSNT